MACLMAQKLDSVMSSICWRIVLLEYKRISINAADHRQHFLHQLNFLVILPVDFSARFKENEVDITELRYCNRDLTKLLKVGCMHRKWLALHDVALFGCHCAYTRSCCEFLGQPQ